MSELGGLLRSWRTTRGVSQQRLADQAGVSARHLSYVENGRSQASRELVLQLARALDVPARQQNTLLLAAGYAPRYSERPLDAAALSGVQQALELMMRQAEPCPSVVIDRLWNVVMSNHAAGRLTAVCCTDPAAVLEDGPPNLLRLLLHPKGLRNAIRNWEEVCSETVQRAEREAHASGDSELRRIVDHASRYPGVVAGARHVAVTEDAPLLIPVSFDTPGGPVDLFTTIATLGTALDVTLQELRIESMFPASAESRAVLERLADGSI